MMHFGDKIVPAEFPELNLLAWNRNPVRPIAPDEAFALYERYWRLVDADNLTPREQLLIKELTDECGHGVMLV